MNREVMATYERKLGAEHPHTLSSEDIFAICLEEAGKYEEAAVMYREVMAARERKLGAEHPDTLFSKGTFKICLRKAGKY